LKFKELNLDGERHLKMSWQDIAAVLEEAWKQDFTQTSMPNKNALSAKRQKASQ
jgi:hypothetical protein